MKLLRGKKLTNRTVFLGSKSKQASKTTPPQTVPEPITTAIPTAISTETTVSVEERNDVCDGVRTVNEPGLITTCVKPIIASIRTSYREQREDDTQRVAIGDSEVGYEVVDHGIRDTYMTVEDMLLCEQQPIDGAKYYLGIDCTKQNNKARVFYEAHNMMNSTEDPMKAWEKQMMMNATYYVEGAARKADWALAVGVCGNCAEPNEEAVTPLALEEDNTKATDEATAAVAYPNVEQPPR
jgi:hypothetical protein